VYREAAGLLTTEFGMTERRACRVLGFDRSTCRYRSQRAVAPPALLASLHRHAGEWTQMGYHKLHALVRGDGFVINHKRFFRIYKAENLRIPRRRRRRKFCGPRQRIPLPDRINQRWSMDFVSDQLALGRRFRTLNIVDDKSRECLSIEVGTSLTGTQVVRVLDRLIQLRGRPEVIVMDNGPEFASHAMADWSMKMGSGCTSSGPASRRRTPSPKASTRSSAASASTSTGFWTWPTPELPSNPGVPATTTGGRTARLESLAPRSIHDVTDSLSRWRSDGGQTS
jgi:putative transposase